MDLDSFLVSLYVLVDDWWKADRPSDSSKPGRPALLADSEVLTLAILSQWSRFRSEWDFWRSAWAHLREYVPNLCSQSPFNRRVRADRALLDEHQREELSELLRKPPEDGGMWNSRKVANWIEEQTGRRIRPQRGWECLRRLGNTPKVPRPSHAKADPVEQQAFKRGPS